MSTPEPLSELPDLRQPELYFNRELSQLEFNRRVLDQAKDNNTPLLERLRFLCIASTNLDEFFEIRVSGLKECVVMGAVQAGPDNKLPEQVLQEIADQAHQLVAEQYRVLNDDLIPALAAEKIRFIRRTEWDEKQEQWIREYFLDELFPVISPLGLDPSHPFPRILNKSLNFIVTLKGKDAFGRSSGVAVVQAPRALPRVIRLPAEISGNGHDFVFLSSIIHAHVEELFPGMKVSGCYQFRVTRNSDLYVDDEEIDDLLRALEGELLSRRYGDAVRLEVADDCTENMENYLLNIFNLSRNDLYQVNGPVNLNRLLAVADMVDRPDLKYPAFVPGLPAPLSSGKGIFEILRKQDILLHHPFESFLPVIEFIKQAASDPHVLTIKQTLYRTGPESAIVNALVEAAQAGKEVTVVIELRARFDEAANIELATRLQEAGAHVVYGIVGYKTHAKMIMVVRREGKRLRRYVHLGTGNYHARTSRLYTDYGLFTCDKDIGKDMHNLFVELTSLGKAPKLNKLIQSPFNLQDSMIEKIEREIAFAKKGKAAHVIIKINSLVEPTIIQTLYQASIAGVKIDLIVRGICCLKPLLPGISENIRVISVIGRFLEHTRVFYFNNNDNPEVYCSSADWMERNFFRRVEVAFPLESKHIRARVIRELQYYLRDNAQAWVLQPDGCYERTGRQQGESAFLAQSALLEDLAEQA